MKWEQVSVEDRLFALFTWKPQPAAACGVWIWKKGQNENIHHWKENRAETEEGIPTNNLSSSGVQEAKLREPYCFCSRYSSFFLLFFNAKGVGSAKAVSNRNAKFGRWATKKSATAWLVFCSKSALKKQQQLQQQNKKKTNYVLYFFQHFHWWVTKVCLMTTSG